EEEEGEMEREEEKGEEERREETSEEEEIIEEEDKLEEEEERKEEEERREESGETRKEVGEDNIEGEEEEIRVIQEVPAQFIKYRNNNEEIEDDEITCVYDDREERRMNGKKEKEKERKKKDERKREELKKEKKINGKVDKDDNRRRRDRDSDKYEKRHKSSDDRSRREKKKKSRSREKSKEREMEEDSSCFFIDTSRDSHQSDNESHAFDSDVIRDIAIASNVIDGEESFTISSLYRGHRELQLKKVENTSFSTVFSPLGGAFDRAMRMWIYTNTGGGTVELATYEGHVKGSIKGFKQPSAIAVITPGALFAVLDFNGIYLIDLIANQKSVIAEGFYGSYRGLAKVSDGNLATIMHVSPYFITVFSTATKNKEVCSIAYSKERGNPSFICSCDELIYTSDLDLNVLSGFSYNAGTKLLSPVSRRNLSDSVNRTASVKTEYMAGVVSDSKHNLLVADASGHTIHLVTSSGSLIQTIPFSDNSLPYIAGLALAPTGRVMTVHRHAHKVELYDLVPIVTGTDQLSSGLKTFSFSRKSPPPTRRTFPFKK
ncbi:hypothetical protein PFISCL1PPCAC_1319, partial [Pristionchus fissidentatus]